MTNGSIVSARSQPRPLRSAAAALACLVAASSLAACSGSDKDGGEEGTPWSEASVKAKELLDNTSGVELSLTTTDDPGVDYLSKATGTIVADPPAFEGKVSGVVSGFPANDLDVISVDGTLWVDISILGGWTDKYQPADLCAPDPATLLDPDSGVSNVLTSTEDVRAGKSERGGADNSDVFRTYSGTATGDSIRSILPCAEGDGFDITYRVDDSGHLRSAKVSGVFFPNADEVTYTIDVDKYDVTKDISAPK
ncbi:MAG: LppX_LprAFG lipoprotein [Nocardioidaceae bacterium]|nr:LppX_LprAFG lipoprotein [Nocardioidaceae bacterium]